MTDGRANAFHLETFIRFKTTYIMMKKVILYISGNVQQVGFRAKTVAIANALDIKGNILNLSDGRVKIIAEGEDADLERLIKGINIKNTLISVSDITKEYSTPTGDYDYFYKLVKDGETDERLDAAAELLKELIRATNSGFENIGGKIDQSRIEITSEIRSTKNDLRYHIDERISMIEHDVAQIKTKVMV